MLIAQISDFHVRAHGAESTFGIDNNTNLSAAVAMLNHLDPAPDVVIGTGDLVNRGRPEEYLALRDLLAPLDAPIYLIPGNHDTARYLRETFSDHDYLASEDEFLSYVVDRYPLRLIGVDSTLPDAHNGAVCLERLAWLRSRLEEAPERPTLLFMHHPPFKTGIWWMDGIGLVEGSHRAAGSVERTPAGSADRLRAPASRCAGESRSHPGQRVSQHVIPSVSGHTAGESPEIHRRAPGVAVAQLDRGGTREPHRVYRLSRRAHRPPAPDAQLGRSPRADPQRTSDPEGRSLLIDRERRDTAWTSSPVSLR